MTTHTYKISSINSIQFMDAETMNSIKRILYKNFSSIVQWCGKHQQQQ